MIQEMWGSFPQLVEQNINSLLDTAEPRATKSFQIYKRVQREGLWKGNFDEFSKRLEKFFSKPRRLRRKSDFDVYLSQPMDEDVFETFHVTFRTAQARDKDIDDIASWAHHLIRVSKKLNAGYMSFDVLRETIRGLTNPGPLGKEENINFADFCQAWQKTVTREFGQRFAFEIAQLVGELRHLQQEAEVAEISQVSIPSVLFTKQEVDWVIGIKRGVLASTPIPKFPYPNGPQKQKLVDLERVVTLFELVFLSSLPELAQHRASIRATILDRCNSLLREESDEGSGDEAA